jgi:hypothetical protein
MARFEVFPYEHVGSKAKAKELEEQTPRWNLD